MTTPAIVYVDISALGAALIDQPQSESLLSWLDADAILTYDRRLGDAARAIGIDVIAPGGTRAT